jgi:hypothetical protein
MLRHVNLTLVGWAIRKFKRFQGRKVGAARFLDKLVRIQPALFEHWRLSMIGAFARWERCEARVSRTVLREADGEIPPAYSPRRDVTP